MMRRVCRDALCACVRSERQQNKLKEELAKAAQREGEAAREEMTRAGNRERLNTRQEAERVKQLVRYEHTHTGSFFLSRRLNTDVFLIFSFR